MVEDGALYTQTFPVQHMATVAVKDTGAAYAVAAPAPRPAQPKAKGKNQPQQAQGKSKCFLRYKTDLKQRPAGTRLAAAIKTVKGAIDIFQLSHGSFESTCSPAHQCCRNCWCCFDSTCCWCGYGTKGSACKNCAGLLGALAK